MFSRSTSRSTKTKQQKLDRLRPPSPWTNDLADQGVAFFIVQASRSTNLIAIVNSNLFSQQFITQWCLSSTALAE